MPAVYDAFASRVHIGTITQSSLPGEHDRHRWGMRLGRPRDLESVAASLEAALTAVRQAWETLCEEAPVVEAPVDMTLWHQTKDGVEQSTARQ